MANIPFAAIILAAGKGTRMKSSLHKVLHPVGGKPMVKYLLETVQGLSPDRTIVVVGSGKEQLRSAITDVEFVEQIEQLGTGHAARVAVDTLDDFSGAVIVLFGDVPFIPPSVMQDMLVESAQPGVGLVVLGFSPLNPGRYGRLILGAGDVLERIVEYKDASEEERGIRLCNSGMMVISSGKAKSWLHALKNENAAQEYYLTDLVALARADGLYVSVITADEQDVLGINSREDLAFAENCLQTRWRNEALDAGVTMVDPSSVFFSADTKIANDVTLEPGVFFGPGVTVETGVTIKAYSYIEHVTLEQGTIVAPFTHLTKSEGK